MMPAPSLTQRRGSDCLMPSPLYCNQKLCVAQITPAPLHTHHMLNLQPEGAELEHPDVHYNGDR